MRDPRSPQVAAFAAAHRDRVEFFQFLQWQADRQLAAASRGWPGSRAFDWTLSGPRGRRQPEWGGSLGRSGAGRAGSIHRRAARRVEPRRAELGLGADQSIGAKAPGLCTLYCVAARQYAPCRDFADRSCDVAQPALLDSKRDGGESRRLRKLPVQGVDPAGCARELASGLRRSRGRSRHCARWVS